jgi:hypothetical protein
MADCSAVLVGVRPVAVGRCQIRRYRVGLTSGVAFQYAALTNALVGLDMRTGRYFLQKNLDRFGATCAFEGERAGGLGHRHFLGLLELSFLLVLVFVLVFVLLLVQLPLAPMLLPENRRLTGIRAEFYHPDCVSAAICVR